MPTYRGLCNNAEFEVVEEKGKQSAANIKLI